MRAAAAQTLSDYGLHDYIVQKWRGDLDTVEIARAVRDVIAKVDGESTLPTVSEAQAYVYAVLARHQDALYAARQQEAQRA